LYPAEYEDPLARIQGDELALRTADPREYESLEDEERRESGRLMVDSGKMGRRCRRSGLGQVRE
jgi:hypothetical protein